MDNSETQQRGHGETSHALSARERMRTRRPIVINNSLSHGICNYNCRLCGVNKSTYHGLQQFQPIEVTQRVIEAAQTAALQGIPIRYLHHSGDGEPTLHPHFGECIHLCSDMLRNWAAPMPAPEMGVVTNGSNLIEPDILASLRDRHISVYVSFPTAVSEDYGAVMFGDPARGKGALERVIPGIRDLMNAKAKSAPEKLYFNISPPDRIIIRQNFAHTVDFLTTLAKEVGLDVLQLIMFSATSNRSGLIHNSVRGIDTYRDLFKAYKGKRINGVTVQMTPLNKRFFPKFSYLVDFVRSFDYPCLWNANVLIAADGSSICSNDQAVRHPFGNIMQDDLATLIYKKERAVPHEICAGCDAAPYKMHGSPLALVFNAAARIRMAASHFKAFFR